MRRRHVLLLAACAAAGIALFLFLAGDKAADIPLPERVPQQLNGKEPTPQEAAGQIASPETVYSYAFVADSAGTVESLMQEKKADGLFPYTSRAYPTLGSFLESVGGVKNGNGTYWMLYINGALSSQGMSQAGVMPGDRIEWRYE